MRNTIRSCWLLMLMALLFLAPRAFADSETLQLDSAPSNNILDGIYVGAYNATNTTTGARTQVICDDFKDDSDSKVYTYNVSTFGNFNNTLWGPGSANLYKQAAWLTLGMLNQTGITQGYYSFAIWAVFAPNQVLSWLKNYNDTAACNAIFGNNCASITASSGSLLYKAQQNYMSGDYSNFLILTPQGCNGAGFCQEQEFFELVPEGGGAVGYLSLAGLSCFGAMWYSKRQKAKVALA